MTRTIASKLISEIVTPPEESVVIWLSSPMAIVFRRCVFEMWSLEVGRKDTRYVRQMRRRQCRGRNRGLDSLSTLLVRLRKTPGNATDNDTSSAELLTGNG